MGTGSEAVKAGIVAMYVQGWVSDEELVREIERLKRQDALKDT